MLDENYVAKLGDFGISRRLNADESRQNTIRNTVSIHMKSLSGLTCPRVISFKTDVYAYDILIFDSSHSNSYQDHIDRCLREGDMNNSQDIDKCIRIALLCTDEVESSRPHMGDVTGWLGTSLGAGLPVVPPPVVHQGNSVTIMQADTSVTNGTMTSSAFSGR
ncbi:cysteine-rich receptor-like protein kinase 44 [Bidens hawaiensis]|uniref:cysteine-rich receptor-like protein kinase 44 n=1 Tax=Bidens hawaiensis TaxID=980011 RepID=UPI00404AEBCB